MILIRVIPTAAHTLEDVEYTLKAFSDIKANLDAGKYKNVNFAKVETDK